MRLMQGVYKIGVASKGNTQCYDIPTSGRLGMCVCVYSGDVVGRTSSGDIDLFVRNSSWLIITSSSSWTRLFKPEESTIGVDGVELMPWAKGKKETSQRILMLSFLVL